MRTLVVFVCAGTAATGAGHLSRCLALAGAYRDAGWRVEFVVTGDAFTHLIGEEYAYHVATSNNALDVLKTAVSAESEMLVVDDYSIDKRIEQDCRRYCRRLAVFDDQTGRKHVCDLLIDAAAPDADSYRGLVDSDARILTGPKYALIGSGIIRRLGTFEARFGRGVANVLISFGATDPAGLTLRTIDAVADKLPQDVKLTVALSSRAPALEAIGARCSSRVRLRVDADMGEVIAAADLAIGAGGVGAFERAALGLPGIVVSAAENQKGVARLLIEAGACLDGGEPDADFAKRISRQLAVLIADEASRARMARAGVALVDGRAAERIRVAGIPSVKMRSGAVVRLRAAELSDEDWLLELQREPATRRFARTPAPPSPEQHKSWLAARLGERMSNLMIVECGELAVGMIRLDRYSHAGGETPRFEISIAVSAAFHGRGIGLAALGLVRQGNPGAVFDAFIFPENNASLRMFRRAGYIDSGNGYYRSDPDRSGRPKS